MNTGFDSNPAARGDDITSPQPYGRTLSTRMDGVGGHWGAIAAGAFTGVAVGVVMTTLGAALGLTASAVAADRASSALYADGIQDAAAGFGFGVGIWLLLSAAVIGAAGGSVLARMARPDRAYSAGTNGLVTWAMGLTVAVLLGASGAGALSTGVGLAAAGAATPAPNYRSTDASWSDAGSSGGRLQAPNQSRWTGRATEASTVRSREDWTLADRDAAISAAKVAASAGATAAWFALVAQLIGLGATVGAASRRRVQIQTAHGVVQPVTA